jgi:hypothetical protein
LCVCYRQIGFNVLERTQQSWVLSLLLVQVEFEEEEVEIEEEVEVDEDDMDNEEVDAWGADD